MVRGAAMMYFDSAATSLQKPPAVRMAVMRAIGQCASVGRGGHAAAMRASELVYTCRETAARLFDAEPEQVIFTMNTTHGLNIALHSLCRPNLRVVVSGFEHNAVMRPLYALGAQVQIVGRRLFDPEGMLFEFEQALRSGAELAVCTCCSNVFGYVLPYMEIAALCKHYGVALILDAAQAAGTLPISLKESGAAFIAMPGHKGLYGPQGTGILLCATEPRPLLYGGTGGNSIAHEMPDFLPDRLEAGTHNVCGIAGLLEGLRYVEYRTPQVILKHEQRLLAQLLEGLAACKTVRLFTGQGQSGVLSLCVNETDCETLSERLGAHGIATRAGLHCAPLAHESAGTLHTGTLRLSISAFNTSQEVRRLCSLCKKLLF